MKQRYDSPEDAIPYESAVLVLSEIDTCFGRPYEELFDEIRDEIGCEKQIVEEHYRTLDDLPDFEALIQYDVWVIHHSCLLIEEISESLPYLATGSFPEATQVVVAVDTDDEGLSDYLCGKIRTAYGNEITTASTRDGLVYFFVGHLNTATPCTGAGLDYIVSRNNRVADRIGRHREIDEDPMAPETGE